MDASPAAAAVFTGVLGFVGAAPLLGHDVSWSGGLDQCGAPTITNVAFSTLDRPELSPQSLAYFGWPRAVTDHSASAWSAARQEQGKSVLRLISEFSEMDENWDGYGAHRIGPQTCRFAQSFIEVLLASPGGLPEPDVTPTPAGTISLDWEVGGADAYLEIGNSRFSGYVKSEGQEPRYIEGLGNELDLRLVTLIQDALFPPVPVSNTVNLVTLRDPIIRGMAA